MTATVAICSTCGAEVEHAVLDYGHTVRRWNEPCGCPEATVELVTREHPGWRRIGRAIFGPV